MLTRCCYSFSEVPARITSSRFYASCYCLLCVNLDFPFLFFIFTSYLCKYIGARCCDGFDSLLRWVYSTIFRRRILLFSFSFCGWLFPWLWWDGSVNLQAITIFELNSYSAYFINAKGEITILRTDIYTQILAMNRRTAFSCSFSIC